MLAIGEKHFIEPAGPRAEGEEDPFPMKFNFFFTLLFWLFYINFLWPQFCRSLYRIIPTSLLKPLSPKYRM